MIPYKHLSLADIFSDCQEKFENDKPAFLSLSETHIDIDEIIPISFRNHFYASTGRTRKYPLRAFLWALIIQRIFSIPTDQLLLTFLTYSKHLREFCGFAKVPDPSKITRFKQDFLDDLQLVFDQLVDITEPICRAIDSAKADMTIFDSSGIEAFVTENNPKYAHRIIRQLKAYGKLRALINPTILIRLPTLPCLPMLLRILKSSSCISMDIFAMSSSSASLPMVSASYAISLFITKVLCALIRTSLWERNPIPLTKINVFTIQNF